MLETAALAGGLPKRPEAKWASFYIQTLKMSTGSLQETFFFFFEDEK